MLFSVQKGLFFWSPLLLLACAGLAWLLAVRTSARAFVAGGMVFLVLNTYLIASWWDWQFGGSFGHRGFTDSLPVFAIGLAGLLHLVGAPDDDGSDRRVLASVAVALSVFQMLQYWDGVLPFSDTTWDQVPRGVPEDEVRRFALAIVACLAVAAVLTYLRDPPWLATLSSGFRNWETAADGTAFRWAGAHASLFVPSNARSLRIPLRTTFDQPGDWPITVSITIDDEPVDRLVLTDPGWRESRIRLPPPGSRRVRRVDLRTDRTRDDNRAVQVGRITLGQVD